MAALRTGTQKSLSFTRPFRNGFLVTRSQNRLVWEPHCFPLPVEYLPFLTFYLPGR